MLPQISEQVNDQFHFTVRFSCAAQKSPEDPGCYYQNSFHQER